MTERHKASKTLAATTNKDLWVSSWSWTS